MRRQLGVGGAVFLGLGSILGTGIFVSVGLAAGLAGPLVVPAVALAALLAVCNGLNSAQLAASHPVSGGAYEYGYRYLSPSLGFVAGWMFLWAKSFSAATAALGVVAYGLPLLGVEAEGRWLVLAPALALAVTALVAGGLRRSQAVNRVIVAVTVAALVAFVLAGLPAAAAHGRDNLSPRLWMAATGGGWREFFGAAALMFVAYTGYGRIATMGEEVRDPRRTIPRAMIVTLAASMILYVGVAAVGVAAHGAEALAAAGSAPLERTASVARPLVGRLIAVGAVTAMLGVLLNLILGLSRVLLAMGRRGDMPAALARCSPAGSPTAAVVAIGVFVALLAALGDVRVTWSFSAFAVLVYYAINNLAALRLPPQERLYPRLFAVAGLVGCLFLAFYVDRSIWLAGLGLIACGFLWRLVRHRLSP